MILMGRTVRGHVIPRLGKLRVHELTPHVVDQVLGQVRSDVGPAAARTVEETGRLRTLLRADRRAVDLDLPDLVDCMLMTGVRLGEAAGWRRIAIPSELLTIIERRQQTQWLQAPRDLHQRSRLPPRPVEHDRRPLEILDRLGFPWVSSHTFRKSVATRLDELGKTPRQIAD